MTGKTTEQRDGYVLRLAEPGEAEALHALMHGVWEGLENREIFAVDDLDLDWVREKLEDRGFGVAACTEDGRLAGMLLMDFPGLSEDNLGWDAGIPETELPRVCLMETAAVLPEHRGHGLERRMLLFAEAHLEGSSFRYLMTTISPDNPASLRSAERCGYRVLMTKEKYGGHLRHILMKPVNGGRLPEGTAME